MTDVLRLISGCLLLAQVAILVVGDMTVGLGFLNGEWETAARVVNGVVYLLPTLVAAALFVAAAVLSKKPEGKA